MTFNEVGERLAKVATEAQSYSRDYKKAVKSIRYRKELAEPGNELFTTLDEIFHRLAAIKLASAFSSTPVDIDHWIERKLAATETLHAKSMSSVN